MYYGGASLAGSYASLADLQAAYASATPGTLALIDAGAGSTAIVFGYDEELGWIPAGGNVGTFASLVALQAAYPTARAGTIATVDTGAGTDATLYAYDADEGWTQIGAAGGAVSTITADVTKTVGAAGDYATWAAALAWVRSAVRLNGAVVTLNFLDAACTENIVIEDEDLSWVNITSAGAVAVDGTAFPVTPLGMRAFIYVRNAKLGEVTGDWALTACAGIISDRSTTRSGAGTFTSGLYNLIVAGSDHTASGTTFNGGTLGQVTVAYSGRADFSGCTFTGTKPVTATSNGRVMLRDLCTMTITDANYCIFASSGAEVSSAPGPASVVGTTYTTSADCAVFSIATGGRISSVKDVHNFAAGNPRLAEVKAGNLMIEDTTGAGGPSARERFYVTYGGVVQAGNISANYAADNIAPNTPSADGLILN